MQNLRVKFIFGEVVQAVSTVLTFDGTEVQNGLLTVLHHQVLWRKNKLYSPVPEVTLFKIPLTLLLTQITKTPALEYSLKCMLCGFVVLSFKNKQTKTV